MSRRLPSPRVVAVGDLPRRADALQLERADVGGRADHARVPQSALVELVFVCVVALVDRWAGGRQRVSPGGSAVGGERQEAGIVAQRIVRQGHRRCDDEIVRAGDRTHAVQRDVVRQVQDRAIRARWYADVVVGDDRALQVRRSHVILQTDRRDVAGCDLGRIGAVERDRAVAERELHIRIHASHERFGAVARDRAAADLRRFVVAADERNTADIDRVIVVDRRALDIGATHYERAAAESARIVAGCEVSAERRVVRLEIVGDIHAAALRKGRIAVRFARRHLRAAEPEAALGVDRSAERRRPDGVDVAVRYLGLVEIEPGGRIDAATVAGAAAVRDVDALQVQPSVEPWLMVEDAIGAAAVDRDRAGIQRVDVQVRERDADGAAGQRDRAATQIRQIDRIAIFRRRDDIAQAAVAAVVAVGHLARGRIADDRRRPQCGGQTRRRVSQKRLNRSFRKRRLMRRGRRNGRQQRAAKCQRSAEAGCQRVLSQCLQFEAHRMSLRKRIGS